MIIAAVIEGGYSKEKDISIKSAKTVFENIDHSKFSPVRVLITKNEWTAYDEDGKYPINKNDFSFVKNKKKNIFKYAFIVIHGSPGEDGKLQGYLDMVGIPYNTSSSKIMSLTFQKFHCNKYLKNFGIKVPEASLINQKTKINTAQIIHTVKLPCFVKPSDGGSSFGVSLVKKEIELNSAINKAFKNGSEVVVEQNIEGREVTCGVYRENEKIKTLPVTEIISENEYFDYDAKYNGKSKEITPAELDDEITKQIKSISKRIYEILVMKGVVRIDFIIDKNEQPYLIEINSIPGMSKESIIPKMLKSEKIDLKELL